jgi:hypothetical protein
MLLKVVLHPINERLFGKSHLRMEEIVHDSLCLPPAKYETWVKEYRSS